MKLRLQAQGQNKSRTGFWSGPGRIQEETSTSTVYREKRNKGLIQGGVCDPGLMHEGSGQGLIQEEFGPRLIQEESSLGLIQGRTKDTPRMVLVTLT